MRRRWTASDLALLQKLNAEGLTKPLIAERLERTLNAVTAQLFKLRHPEKYQAKLAKARAPKVTPSARVLVLPKRFHGNHTATITLAKTAGEFASARVRTYHGASA